jgi:hypothetical protein
LALKHASARPRARGLGKKEKACTEDGSGSVFLAHKLVHAHAHTYGNANLNPSDTSGRLCISTFSPKMTGQIPG